MSDNILKPKCSMAAWQMRIMCFCQSVKILHICDYDKVETHDSRGFTLSPFRKSILLSYKYVIQVVYNIGIATFHLRSRTLLLHQLSTFVLIAPCINPRSRAYNYYLD